MVHLFRNAHFQVLGHLWKSDPAKGSIKWAVETHTGALLALFSSMANVAFVMVKTFVHISHFRRTFLSTELRGYASSSPQQLLLPRTRRRNILRPLRRGGNCQAGWGVTPVQWERWTRRPARPGDLNTGARAPAPALFRWTPGWGEAALVRTRAVQSRLGKRRILSQH